MSILKRFTWRMVYRFSSSSISGSHRSFAAIKADSHNSSFAHSTSMEMDPTDTEQEQLDAKLNSFFAQLESDFLADLKNDSRDTATSGSGSDELDDTSLLLVSADELLAEVDGEADAADDRNWRKQRTILPPVPWSEREKQRLLRSALVEIQVRPQAPPKLNHAVGASIGRCF